MIVQILNLSSFVVFNTYCKVYNIDQTIRQQGIPGLEIRNIPISVAHDVQNKICNDKKSCFIKTNEQGEASVLLIATFNELKELAKISFGQINEELGKKIITTINNFEAYDSKEYIIGKKVFNFNNAYVMGILNVTPDSFSDGGLYYDKESAVKHAIDMIDLGADIVDIGGESTRPGSEMVQVEEEIERVIPVLDRLLFYRPNAIISVDTNKSVVAEKALKHGAKIINDISGLTFDPEIARVVKHYNAALIIMHIKGKPKDMQVAPSYNNVVSEIYDFLYDKLLYAKEIGVEGLFIDPGIGFGKSIDNNFEIIRRLEEFRGLGYPIMIGISRKSFLGKTLNLDINLRDTATTIAESMSVKNGARIIRTHNVYYGMQVCKLMNHLN